MEIPTMIIWVASILSASGVIINSVGKAKHSSKKAINKYISELLDPSLDEIKEGQKLIVQEINSIKENIDEKEIQRLRYACLCFSSDIRKGIPKTRQEYEEIFRMEDTYNTLIKKYNIKNGYMEEEMLYIHEQYKKLIQN